MCSCTPRGSQYFCSQCINKAHSPAFAIYYVSEQSIFEMPFEKANAFALINKLQIATVRLAAEYVYIAIKYYVIRVQYSIGAFICQQRLLTQDGTACMPVP